MALASWWQNDPLPTLKALPDFSVKLADNNLELARLNRLSVREVETRKQAGHRPYIGWMDGTPVTYGWVATRAASIGELDLDFALPANERYLWDFATHADWQGRGLYPRLLQAIIRAEGAERYWIIYAPENLPSGAGIQKAGFQIVGQLSFRADGRVGLIPTDNAAFEKAGIGAVRLGVDLFDDGLSPCWGCIGQVVCKCKINPELCTCAIEVHSHSHPEVGAARNLIVL
jgi:GNAT superfamily N-acetyltransferase